MIALNLRHPEVELLYLFFLSLFFPAAAKFAKLLCQFGVSLRPVKTMLAWSRRLNRLITLLRHLQLPLLSNLPISGLTLPSRTPRCRRSTSCSTSKRRPRQPIVLSWKATDSLRVGGALCLHIVVNFFLLDYYENWKKGLAVIFAKW